MTPNSDIFKKCSIQVLKRKEKDINNISDKKAVPER